MFLLLRFCCIDEDQQSGNSIAPNTRERRVQAERIGEFSFTDQNPGVFAEVKTPRLNNKVYPSLQISSRTWRTLTTESHLLAIGRKVQARFFKQCLRLCVSIRQASGYVRLKRRIMVTADYAMSQLSMCVTTDERRCH